MKLFTPFFAAVLSLLGEVAAHGMHERSMHPREIASRQLAANKRHIKARNCAPQIAEYQRKRKMAKRALLKRDFTATTSAIQPHETTIKNDTCVLAPEVEEGPYFVNNDLVRQDVREGQVGVPLALDIGIIDTTTCLPLADTLVEIWHCNSTGFYSGFTEGSLDFGNGTFGNGTFGGGNGTFPGGGGNGTSSFSLDPSASSSSGGAIPSGAIPSGGVGGSASKTDNLNFLRGGWPTNDQGIVEFDSVYPGFYSGRTVHIHIIVHQNVTYNTNGTYSSKSGSVVHIGQMFFEEDLNAQVLALDPYTTNQHSRTYNDEDRVLAQENSNGYSGYVDASLVGSDLSDGILGFITVGVDSTASYQIGSDNFYTSDGAVYEAVTSTSTTDVLASSSSSSSVFTSTSSSVNATVATRSTVHSTSIASHQSSSSPPSPHQPQQDQHDQPGPHGGDHGHGNGPH